LDDILEGGRPKVDSAGTRTIIYGNLTETTKVLAALRLPANPP